MTYQKNGDYLIPEIQMDEQPEETLTKYGLMRKKYLEENKPGRYSTLLLTNELMNHLFMIQEQGSEPNGKF